MMIRASRDQSSFDNSPGLIAVFHALLRLLAPRHPPHALGSLTALILSSDDFAWTTHPAAYAARLAKFRRLRIVCCYRPMAAPTVARPLLALRARRGLVIRIHGP